VFWRSRLRKRNESRGTSTFLLPVLDRFTPLHPPPCQATTPRRHEISIPALLRFVWNPPTCLSSCHVVDATPDGLWTVGASGSAVELGQRMTKPSCFGGSEGRKRADNEEATRARLGDFVRRDVRPYRWTLGRARLCGSARWRGSSSAVKTTVAVGLTRHHLRSSGAITSMCVCGCFQQGPP
jgi:hypothetical protein